MEVADDVTAGLRALDLLAERLENLAVLKIQEVQLLLQGSDPLLVLLLLLEQSVHTHLKAATVMEHTRARLQTRTLGSMHTNAHVWKQVGVHASRSVHSLAYLAGGAGQGDPRLQLPQNLLLQQVELVSTGPAPRGAAPGGPAPTGSTSVGHALLPVDQVVVDADQGFIVSLANKQEKMSRAGAAGQAGDPWLGSGDPCYLRATVQLLQFGLNVVDGFLDFRLGSICRLPPSSSSCGSTSAGLQGGLKVLKVLGQDLDLLLQMSYLVLLVLAYTQKV